MTQRLLGSNVPLWGELFEPVFIEKIDTLIQGKLNDGLEAMKQSIEKNYVKFELKPWLWGESPNDLPQSSVVLPKSTGMEFFLRFQSAEWAILIHLFAVIGLFMKTRCYMPTVQQLCSLWDQKLTLLREDLAHYQEGSMEQDRFIPFNKFEKRSEINKSLENQCINSVKKYDRFQK